jgi:hypothetical protein
MPPRMTVQTQLVLQALLRELRCPAVRPMRDRLPPLGPASSSGVWLTWPAWAMSHQHVLINQSELMRDVVVRALADPLRARARRVSLLVTWICW